MAIDFSCPSCNARLSAVEAQIGAQIPCRVCGQLVSVPWVGAPAGQSSNPYAAPMAGVTVDGRRSDLGEMDRGTIAVGDVLERTWKIMSTQVGLCIGAAIVIIVLWLPAIAFVFWVQIKYGFLISLAANVPLAFYQTWLTGGAMLFFLNIATGRPASLTDIFSGGRWYLPLLITNIIVGVALNIGFLLLIVPAIIIQCYIWPYNLLIIDRNFGAMDSLSTATKITEGNRFNYFVTTLVATLAGGMVSSMTCLAGAVLVLPYLVLLHCVMYLTITGQPTVDQLAERSAN